MRRLAVSLAVCLTLGLAAGPAVGHPGHGSQPQVDPTVFQAQPEPPDETKANDALTVGVLALLIVTAVALAGLKEAGRRSRATP